MDTAPYSTKPAGQDTAMLRLYLPAGVTGGLTVSENDNHFRFTEETSVDAQLIESSTVSSNCDSAAEATANSRFAVTIGGSELSQGISKSLTEEITKYVCTVYSHKNLTISDISQNSASGLQLNLTLTDLQKNGADVGENDPSTVNNGELQIRTVPFRVSLLITKQVENSASTKAFPFTLSLKDENNQPIVPASASVTGTASGVSIDSTTGAITFSLQDDQSIRLSDIPTGSAFTLTETEHNGFTVVIKENNIPIATGDSLTNYPLDRNRSLVVVNSGGYELPATGGSGILYYIIFGIVIMAVPIIIGFVLRHSKKRRVVK